jgi:hypothetical protein
MLMFDPLTASPGIELSGGNTRLLEINTVTRKNHETSSDFLQLTTGTTSVKAFSFF